MISVHRRGRAWPVSLTAAAYAAAMLMLCVASATAQSPLYRPAAERLSLTDARLRALANNLELRIARADTGFAVAQLVGSRLRPNPALAVQYQTTGDRAAGALEGEASVSITQELQLWGVRRNRIRAAGLDRQRTIYLALDAQRLLRREVTASYREMLFQQERRALLDSLTGLNSRIARAAQLAFQQGLGSELDARLSVAAWQQALLDRDRALREYDIEQLQLAKLLGDSLGTVYQLSDSLPVTGLAFLAVRAPMPATAGATRVELAATGVDSLVRLALATRPDVRAVEYEIESSVALLAAASGAGRPTVAVGGLFSRSRDNFSLGAQQGTSVDRSFGLGVVLGLPVANRNQGEIARAEFAGAAARLRLANVRQLIERDVRVAASRVALSASQVATLRQAILPANTAALRIVQAAFGRGQASIFQVLQVQRSYVDASTGLLEALRQYVAALADLEAAVGQPVQ